MEPESSQNHSNAAIQDFNAIFGEVNHARNFGFYNEFQYFEDNIDSNETSYTWNENLSNNAAHLPNFHNENLQTIEVPTMDPHNDSFNGTTMLNNELSNGSNNDLSTALGLPNDPLSYEELERLLDNSDNNTVEPLIEIPSLEQSLETESVTINSNLDEDDFDYNLNTPLCPIVFQNILDSLSQNEDNGNDDNNDNTNDCTDIISPNNSIF